MQLFGSYTSPFVRHCRIALLETGLACDFVKSDLAVSAAKSPTQKVPFLVDGDLVLTDSSAILRHLREKAARPFLPSIVDYDRYLLINTALDAGANLFLLAKDGITPDQSAYLQRQRRRIDTCLAVLEPLPWPDRAPYDDVDLRLGCFMDWCLFREQRTFETAPRLSAFLQGLRGYAPFAETAPHD